MLACDFCERLYSKYSISIHSRKCKYNPNVVVDTSTLESGKKQSFATKKKKNTERPRTRSLCRHIEVPHRICYICGDELDGKDFEAHQNKCLKEWRVFATRVPSQFQLFHPVPLLIPSVDGSLDIQRLNQHAISQSKKAQNPRCKRCGTSVSIKISDEHKCMKREPLIEYYF